MKNKNFNPIFTGIAIIFVIFLFSIIFSRFFKSGSKDEFDIINTNSENESKIESSSEIETSSLYYNNNKETEIQNETNLNSEEYEIFNGYHRFEYPYGDIYDGYWTDDLYNGEGTLYKADDQRVYQGIFEKGNFISGKISLKINNYGGIRTFEVNNNKSNVQNGYDIRMFENGDFYAGEFVDGSKSGQGLFYNYAERTFYDGYFENNDFLNGSITILCKDGIHTYYIEIKNKMKNGKLRLFDEKGLIKKEENFINNNIL